MESEFKYRAFISYSHRDERWAGWLHRSLESYRVPRRLVGTVTEFGVVPERIAPVFRDRDELTAATNLGDKLTRALEQSAFLIVICSPAAARSRWVNEEVLAYKRLGREHRIFCLIVDGEPGASARPETADRECFPRALIYKLGPDGALSTELSEPIAADARPDKDVVSTSSSSWSPACSASGSTSSSNARHIAAIDAWRSCGLGDGNGDHVGARDAAWLARNEAERQRVRAEAEAETARQTTRFMVDLFKVSDPSEALGNTITAREILDKGAKRIDTELKDQPGIQATLMDTMGTVYTSLGLYGSAMPLAREALDKRRLLPRATMPHGGEPEPSRHRVLAQRRLCGGRAAAARGARDAAQRVRQGQPGSRDTLSALADVMSFTGEYAEGEPMIAEAFRIRRKLSAARIRRRDEPRGPRPQFRRARRFQAGRCVSA